MSTKAAPSHSAAVGAMALILLSFQVVSAAAAEEYCDNQRGICRTLCTQVTNQAAARRLVCNTGCERSAQMCQSTGRFNFAVVEQFMPEFHQN